MKKWCAVGGVVLALACGEARTAKVADTAVSVDSVVAQLPIRVDSLREADGELYSPTWLTFAMTRAGNVIAIDQDDKRLALFDTLGRKQYAVGRNGSGPGEFRFPNRIFVLPGDSIAVWDSGLRRISYFDDTLKFVRTEQFALWNFTGGQSQIVGRLSDGRWVAQMESRAFNPDPEVGARIVFDTARLVAGRSDEAPVTLLTLRPTRGVDVVARTGKSDLNIYRLQLTELDMSVGAVCERGIVTTDITGEHEFDISGRKTRSAPLARVGDSIVSESERREIVDSKLMGPLATSPEADNARKFLAEIARDFPARLIAPQIGADGRRWYGLHAGESPK